MTPLEFSLRVARKAIELEMKGMRRSRGSAKVIWAVHYGLSVRCKPEAVIAKINEELRIYEEARLQ